MKRLVMLCSILCLGFFILLTGCTDPNNLPAIEGTMSTVIYKTAISVNTSFTDTNEHDLYHDMVKVFVSLSSTGDEAKEISRKDVLIVKPTVGEDGSISKEMSGQKLEFSNLTADTKYVLKLVITASGSQKTLNTREVTTINNGESEDDPILIDSLDLLLGMNKDKKAYYKLTADIDCGGTLSSIFNSSSYFSGKLDGDGHKIYNMTFDSNNYTGLFGYMQGATVKNLVIEDATYNASRSETYLGALAGYAKNCTIQNVTVNRVDFSHSGQSTRNSYLGGLVGKAEDSTIENCVVNDLSLKIIRGQLRIYVGGFIGINENTKITNCHVNGTMDTTIVYTNPSSSEENNGGCFYLGGFCGVNDSNLGIHSSYSKVNITVKEDSVNNSGTKKHKTYVGGFAGGNIHDGSKFIDCAAIGEINVKAENMYTFYFGGFAGYTDDQNISRFENCIYVPTGTGVTIDLMPKKEEKESTGDSTDKEEDEEEDKGIAQTAYVSLAIGRIGEKSRQTIINVIVYRDVITINNEHEKTNKTLYTVSTDISLFSQAIQTVIRDAA